MNHICPYIVYSYVVVFNLVTPTLLSWLGDRKRTLLQQVHVSMGLLEISAATIH